MTDTPVLYEWRRPDGNVLTRHIVQPWGLPSLWPFSALYPPAGPVEVWRMVKGEEPEMIAQTPDGPTAMVIYSGGQEIPFYPPRNP